MKTLNKKIFGFGAAAILMFISLASGSSFVNQDTINETLNLVTQNEKEPLNLDNRTFKCEINPIGYNHATKGQCNVESNGYEVNLTAEKADYVVTTIKNLDEAYNQTKDPEKRLMIIEEKLQLLREVGILPQTFTMENITKTAQLLKQITDENSKKSVKDYGGIFFQQPIIGLGAILISFVPVGELVPFPIPPPIYFEIESIPLFDNINITILVCAYSAELLVCHSALALNMYVTVLPPQSGIFLGPYYSVWLAVIGFSITVYLEYYPEVILLDLDMFVGGFASIFPFVNTVDTE